MSKKCYRFFGGLLNAQAKWLNKMSEKGYRLVRTGNALLYISLSYVDFGRVRPGGRALFFSWKTLRLLPILQSGCHSNRQSCGNLLKCSAVGYA